MTAAEGRVEKIAVAKYSLPRRQGGTPKGWSMAKQKEGTELGHGWRLRSSNGEPADAMKAILKGIAAQAKEETLEFEADEKEVAAYWKEWGGAEHVDDIHHWLLALSQY
jgi:hypothetical protein